MIFIARHAETLDNAARVFQVPAAPLSAAGRAQARRLAKRVEANGISRILSSDLTRALETAACIGAHLSLEVEVEPLLRERDFGELRGRPYASLAVDPFAAEYVPPQGESWSDFHQRVGSAWERIKEAAAGAQGNLLVVTHGLVCRALTETHLALQPGHTPPSRWENSSITEVEAIPPWMIRRLNCVAHLASER